MTFHVGLASVAGAVMISDSQGSTDVAERHGFQKQHAGDGFLIGGAGHGAIVNAVLHETHMRTSGAAPLTSSDLEGHLTGYLVAALQPEALRQVSLLVVRHDGGRYVVQEYHPGLFRSFGRETDSGIIGSGAEHAATALRHLADTGITFPRETLADLLIAAKAMADAANESLTVDDYLFVGFLRGARSYMLCDGRINASFAPLQVLQQRHAMTAAFTRLRTMVETVQSELATAYRAFSDMRVRPLLDRDLHLLQLSSLGVQVARENLTKELDDYMAWYDGLLGR